MAAMAAGIGGVAGNGGEARISVSTALETARSFGQVNLRVAGLSAFELRAQGCVPSQGPEKLGVKLQVNGSSRSLEL